MASLSWNCPYCGHTTTIVDTNIRTQSFDLDIENTAGRVRLITTYIVCPNDECLKFTLKSELYSTSFESGLGDTLKINFFILGI